AKANANGVKMVRSATLRHSIIFEISQHGPSWARTCFFKKSKNQKVVHV
ncbi:21592_t:CDS:2, partial [Racocetra persica]